MHVTMVKKRLASGEPCRKCAQAEDLLRSRGLWDRIDEVVLFAPLTHDEVREIARHYLTHVKDSLARAGKTIHVSEQALEMVVVQGYSLAFGARFLKRVIDERIKLPISSLWKTGSHFDVIVKDGELVVEPGPARLPDATGTVAA